MDGLWRLRAAGLTLLGAAAVHAGRYALAPPQHRHEAVHAYLGWLVPVLAVVAAAGLIELLIRARGSRFALRPPMPGLGQLTSGFALALVMIFGAQEILEGVFSHGQVPVENVFVADGGWTAIPLAVLVGALLAVAFRGVVGLAVRLSRGRTPDRVAATPTPAPPAYLALARPAPLALSLAPRGPPV